MRFDQEQLMEIAQEIVNRSENRSLTFRPTSNPLPKYYEVDIMISDEMVYVTLGEDSFVAFPSGYGLQAFLFGCMFDYPEDESKIVDYILEKLNDPSF